jgi:hypothetical protein
MLSRAAFICLVALAFAAPARAASGPIPYDAKAAPLDDLSKELLTGTGYELRDDGSVWDKISGAPVAATDMPYLLSRLAGAKRLHALLEINNIITRYDSERHLTPEDREAVRVLVRKNWVVFGSVPRGDFRSYFSGEELEALDKIPPRFAAMGTLSMTDPLPEVETSPAPPSSATVAAPTPTAPPPAAVPAPAPVAVSSAPLVSTSTVVAVPVIATPPVIAAPVAAPAVVPIAAKVVPSLTPLMDVPSLKRDSPFAPAVSTAPKTNRIEVPAFKVEPAAPPPAPAPVVAAPSAPSTSSVVASDLGTLKTWTAPPVSTAAVAAAPAVPAKPVAPPAPPPPPEPPKPAIGEGDYQKFVAAGPYTKDGRALLDLIGKRAPEFCLPLLRRTVVGAVPQISVDAARTGLELRAGFARDAADPLAPPVVALSPGPAFIVVKKGMFGAKQEVLLPDAPQSWAALGVARPGVAALSADARPASSETSDWGATRVYADGSRRGSFSTEEQAGELLEQLLLIGLSRERQDASAYAARRWARTARLMFSQRIKEELQRDDFLDPARRAELREWLDHPDEDDDVAVAMWSASRSGVLDPRRGPPEAARDFETRARASCSRSALEDGLAEASRRRAAAVGALELLADAGVVDAEAAKAAAGAATGAESAERGKLLSSPPACPPLDAGRDEALHKSGLLLAEASRAERVMREHKAEVESHAR